MRKCILLFCAVGLSQICLAGIKPFLEVNGSKAGPFTFSGHTGQTICITLRAICDTSIGDSSLLSWKNPGTGAIFNHINASGSTAKTDEGVFCWTPNENQGCAAYHLVFYLSMLSAPNQVMDSITITITVAKHSDAEITRTKTAPASFEWKPVYKWVCQAGDTINPSYQWMVSTKNNGFWNPNQCVVYNTKLAQHTFSQNGTYICRLRLEQILMNTTEHVSFYFDTITVSDAVGTSSPLRKQDLTLQVFPNPINKAGDKLIYIYSLNEIHRVSLTNALGKTQELQRYIDNRVHHETTYQIPVNMSEGLYILTIQDASGEISSRNIVLQ